MLNVSNDLNFRQIQHFQRQSNLNFATYRQGITDQPKKKALFLRFAAEHPLRKKNFFAEKNKNHLFHPGFSPRNFAEKL